MQATLKFLRLACNTITSKQIFFSFAKSLNYFVWEILILQNRGNAIVSPFNYLGFIFHGESNNGYFLFSSSSSSSLL